MTSRSHPRPVVVGECEVVFAGQVVPCVIRRSLKARYARLEIRPGAGLFAIIPRNFPLQRVPEILRRKQVWITANLGKCGPVSPPAGSGVWGGAVTLPYLGREVPVVILPANGRRGDVTLEADRLVVRLAAGDDNPGRALERWYRAQAARLLQDKAERAGAGMGVRYNRLTVRGQKSRWGSCSPRGNLSLNWKLLLAPEPVIDYVVIHELAHLREMNHSRRFWQLVAEYCPGWRQPKKWLREHAGHLARTMPGRAG